MQSPLLSKYFPELQEEQLRLLKEFAGLIVDFNARINLISRKDTENFNERHILHSLSIAKVFPLEKGEHVLDLGTGGGFPGIPLAIYFPELRFTLIDSIQKKISAVSAMVQTLGLSNVDTVCSRAEEHHGTYDKIVSRAVAPLSTIVSWTRHLMNPDSATAAWICLKGGELEEELADFPSAEVTELSTYFKEEFFETKKILILKHKDLKNNKLY